MTGNHINWTYLIRQRMKKALKENASLPYAFLITRILQHFDIPLDDGIPGPRTRQMQISRTSLDSFGFKLNANNIWVPKNAPRPSQGQSEAPPQQQLPPPPILDTQTSSYDDLMRGINDLRTFVGDSFNTMNENINTRLEQLEINMGDRFDTLETRVDHLEHEILHRHFGPHGGSSS
ncbi:uncharacterized protein LOC106768862 [Vigna radiata var. radiata]|uniref:Uncharacterized protein LOC106768862 n=1 Tax=Vigna radiata var. radiata TaxID=3916 RepID=A0A1S3UUR5_VIGRR|nr:uncharacterized protein LOC106768862 [Vigna radiata var. radiata]